MKYSYTQLEAICKTNSEDLYKMLISPSTDVATLSTATEVYASEVSDETLVVPVLRQLLKHIHASVRESAVIGIGAFFVGKEIPQDISEKLNLMMNKDPSLDIREQIKEMVKERN